MEVPRHQRKLFVWCLQHGVSWIYLIYVEQITKQNSGRKKRLGALTCKSHWNASSGLGALHLLCWLESCHEGLWIWSKILLVTKCPWRPFHGPEAPSSISCERLNLIWLRGSVFETKKLLGLLLQIFWGITATRSASAWVSSEKLLADLMESAHMFCSKSVVVRTHFPADCSGFF